MIFGKEYDLSLWYMLKVKNRYRRKAIKLIKELPEEFLEHIRTVYSNGIEENAGLDNNKQDPYFNIQSSIDPNIFYRFYIMCRNLYIFKMKNKNGVSKSVFSLIINPNNAKDIIEMKKQQYLGAIGIGAYPTLNYKEAEYDLKKSRFGNTISQTNAYLGNLVNIKLYRPVSIKNMPDELYRERTRKNKLSRIKKK